jgi:formate dehydrogenase major subunit
VYNRASADPSGKPSSERMRWVWRDEAQGRWTGYDVPDFPATKPPLDERDPNGVGMVELPGTWAFILMLEGLDWLYVPTGLVDGPLPTHYEPVESPVANPLYSPQTIPVVKIWQDAANPLAGVADPAYPRVLTIDRLTDHYLSGAMSRWLSWLVELQPALLVELSPELAAEQGMANLDWVRISTSCGRKRSSPAD